MLAGCGGQAPEPPVANEFPPTVRLTADRLAGEATFTSTFRAAASDPDGNALTFEWSIDDVTDPSARGSSASVTFREAGTFVVGVRVSDGTFSATDRVTVEVRNDYRPAEAPDVLVLSFSGRCNILTLCNPPSDNYDYLGNAIDPGTTAAIVGSFEALGYATSGINFRAHLEDDGTRGFGYRTAEDVLAFVRDEWIRDFLDPTRVVLAAHSHGTQFMSLLAFDHPEVVFEYAVYLDAVCELWDVDHEFWFAFAYGDQANYPYPMNVTGRACGSLSVPGLSAAQHLADVVPWNVLRALEVRSGDPLVWDARSNHRPNGSTGAEAGIATQVFAESHGRVAHAASTAMAWVTNMIAFNGVTTASAPNARPLSILPPPTVDTPPQLISP